MQTSLTQQCDATASGTEAGTHSWLYVLTDFPLELNFCDHHNAQHAEALEAAGWIPFQMDPAADIAGLDDASVAR